MRALVMARRVYHDESPNPPAERSAKALRVEWVPDVEDELRRIAFDECRSESEIVREALHRFFEIEDQLKEEKAMTPDQMRARAERIREQANRDAAGGYPDRVTTHGLGTAIWESAAEVCARLDDIAASLRRLEAKE